MIVARRMGDTTNIALGPPRSPVLSTSSAIVLNAETYRGIWRNSYDFTDLATNKMTACATADAGRKYLKAQHANLEDGRLFRLLEYGKSGQHQQISDSKPITCVLCCCKAGKDSKHTRIGYKTTVACSTCRVKLCDKLRWTADYRLVDVNWAGNPLKSTATLSCYDVYHTANELPNIGRSFCKIDGVLHNEEEPMLRPPLIPKGQHRIVAAEVPVAIVPGVVEVDREDDETLASAAMPLINADEEPLAPLQQAPVLKRVRSGSTQLQLFQRRVSSRILSETA